MPRRTHGKGVRSVKRPKKFKLTRYHGQIGQEFSDIAYVRYARLSERGAPRELIPLKTINPKYETAENEVRLPYAIPVKEGERLYLEQGKVILQRNGDSNVRDIVAFIEKK